jgi:hypothetical protein
MRLFARADVEGQPRIYRAVAVTRSGQRANHIETVGKHPDLLCFRAFVLHPLEDEISDFGFAPGRTFDIAQIERQSDEFVSVKLDLQLMQSIVDARNTERAMLAGALPVHRALRQKTGCARGSGAASARSGRSRLCVRTKVRYLRQRSKFMLARAVLRVNVRAGRAGRQLELRLKNTNRCGRLMSPSEPGATAQLTSRYCRR